MRNFRTLLKARVEKGFSVVVGLDPDLDRIPWRSWGWELLYSILNWVGLRWLAVVSKIYWFNREIVGATHDIAGVYKVNNAFYIAEGIGGIIALWLTVRNIQRVAPDVPVILDAKYGDTRNTNVYNAKIAFDVLNADAVTVLPYFGGDSLEPFLERKERGVFVTCHTAFPRSREFQDVGVGESNQALYQLVANRVAKVWNKKHRNCGVVVGSPQPYELGEIRRIVGDIPILVLGEGAKVENLAQTVPAGGSSAIFGQSRWVLYACPQSSFFEKEARRRVENMQAQIDQYR